EDRLEADCVVLADYELPEDTLYRQVRRALPGLEMCRVGGWLAPRRGPFAPLGRGGARRGGLSGGGGPSRACPGLPPPAGGPPPPASPGPPPTGGGESPIAIGGGTPGG